MEHHPKYGGVAGYGHKGHDFDPVYVSPSQAYPTKTAGYGTGPCHTGVLSHCYNPYRTTAFTLVLFILLVIILRAWW